MDAVLPIALIAIGAVALFFGSRWLVDGAGALALRFNIRPVVIGLTVVALGTSSPEAVLAIISAWEGNSAISLGNVIGANISNGALVLGLACLMGPVALRATNLRRESFFLLLAGPLLAVLAWDGRLDLVDGVIMLAVVAVFFYTLYRTACRGEECAVVKQELELMKGLKPRSLPMIVLLVVAGSALLAVAAEVVVYGASALALGVGVSETVIGLTIVALGTTIPEMTIALTAPSRGRSDVVLGNVVGTIIINTLFILGLGSVIGGYSTTGIETMLGVGVMVVLSIAIVVLLAVLDSGGRKMGAAMVAAYAGYIVAAVVLG